MVNESKYGRSELLDAKDARRVAKGRATRAANTGGIDTFGADIVRGENLKEGIMGMAQKANVDPETWAKLERMDPEKLDALYQNNKFVFDVYFNYGNVGVDEDGAMDYVDKNSDIDFLVETYERSFGVTLRWGAPSASRTSTARTWRRTTTVSPRGSCSGPSAQGTASTPARI